MKYALATAVVALTLVRAGISTGLPQSERPFLTSELLFPLEHWHNHGSAVVELPNGDLLACWFHGSGERTADDVVVRGARLSKGSRTWSAPFVMADTPGYPDTNSTMFVDPKKRVWLLWPTILANEWQTALMKYKIASTFDAAGRPRWDVSDVLHVTPGDEFARTVNAELDRMLASGEVEKAADGGERGREYFERLRKDAANKLTRRLGWMTRAHPYVLEGSRSHLENDANERQRVSLGRGAGRGAPASEPVGESEGRSPSGTRLIVPLYSDGFNFSLMAITDDWGATWKTSTPLVGLGNVQPSIARKKDGTLVAYMRDNGPPPKRLMVSRSTDRGETWSRVEDSDRPNPGSGAEVTVLKNGHWVLVSNDLERGRHSLAVALSEDEGATWRWTRHLELDTAATDDARLRGEYHYPSIIQAADGTLHVTYSYFAPPASVVADGEGRLPRKAIKHAHFNEAWIRQP